MSQRPRMRNWLRPMFSWLVVVSVFAQPVVVWLPTCQCAASPCIEPAEANSGCGAGKPRSCCDTAREAALSESSENSCCASSGNAVSACKCDPSGLSCQCGDCQCANRREPSTVPPAVPPTESHKTPTQTFLTLSFVDAIHCRADRYPSSVHCCPVKPVSFSAQEACVLLSRFTC